MRHPAPQPAGSANEALQFLFAPGERLLDRLSSQEPANHAGNQVTVPDLHSDVRRGGGTRDIVFRVMPRPYWIVVDRALRGLYVTPNTEIRHRLERRDVVADHCRRPLLDLLPLGKVFDQLLRRWLVLGKGPDPPEVRTVRHQPTLRPNGVREGPAVLGDLRRV